MLKNLTPVTELYVSQESAQKLKVQAATFTSWNLSPRQISDIELLMNGAFAPLNGFLSETDYSSVMECMRLANGDLWPIPINLDVSHEFADSVEIGQNIALRDLEGVILAVLNVTDKWKPNKIKES